MPKAIHATGATFSVNGTELGGFNDFSFEPQEPAQEPLRVSEVGEITLQLRVNPIGLAALEEAVAAQAEASTKAAQAVAEAISRMANAMSYAALVGASYEPYSPYEPARQLQDILDWANRDLYPLFAGVGRSIIDGIVDGFRSPTPSPKHMRLGDLDWTKYHIPKKYRNKTISIRRKR